MTQELQDKLKLVAEWLGWEFKMIEYGGSEIMGFYFEKELRFIEGEDYLPGFLEVFHYHDDWSKQIPVWAKLCKSQIKEISMVEWISIRDTYMEAVSTDKPQEGFEIIVLIIQRIKS